MKIEWNKKYTTISAYVLIVTGICILLYFCISNLGYFKNIFKTVYDIMSPFIIGFIFAYVFEPIMSYFEKNVLPFITFYKFTRRTYRNLSIFFTLILGIGAIALLFSFIIPELFNSVNSLILQIKAYIPNFENFINQISDKLHMEKIFEPIIGNISSTIEGFFSKSFGLLSKSLSSIVNTTINITSAIVDILIGVVITIYLWSSKEMFFAQIKKISYAVFPNSFVDNASGTIRETNRIFGKFISGKFIDAAIIGVLCYLGMLILNIPFPLLISVIVSVTNVIPYFGPFIGAVPSVLLLLVIDPIKALTFAVFILILQQIEGNIIEPKILGETTGLPAFWIIFSVTLFGGLFGFAGMLLGVPVFAVIYTAIKRFVNKRLQAKEMSTQTVVYASKANPLIKKNEKVHKKSSED